LAFLSLALLQILIQGEYIKFGCWGFCAAACVLFAAGAGAAGAGLAGAAGFAAFGFAGGVWAMTEDVTPNARVADTKAAAMRLAWRAGTIRCCIRFLSPLSRLLPAPSF
jgi:hypothetical protein